MPAFLLTWMRDTYYYFARGSGCEVLWCVRLYVCLRICLSARISKFLCMLPMAVAQSSSSKLTKSKGEGAILGVFFFIDNALYSVAFGTHTKKSWTDRDAIWDYAWAWPEEPCVMWGAILGENMCPTSLLLRIIANLTGHAASHDRGRRFIASVGRVYYRPQRGGIAHHGRSLISTIALFCYYAVFSLCLCICFIFYVLVCTSTLLFRIPTESAVLFIFK